MGFRVDAQACPSQGRGALIVEVAGATFVQPEAREIFRRYERRSLGVNVDRYSPLNDYVVWSRQERLRVLIRLLRDLGRPLPDLRVLEVGCGSGGNLLELLCLGFDPAKLVGVELLPERVAQARRQLPPETVVVEGDFSEMRFPKESFDVVYQSTVFSSILDDEFQERLAAAMWKCVTPGGRVLWYDFVFDNPANRDVRGVPRARVEALFPDGAADLRKVTLAPPIGRIACRLFPPAYLLFGCVPLLRSHLIGWVAKRYT
jgi:SAM-dependent methyltransferase